MQPLHFGTMLQTLLSERKLSHNKFAKLAGTSQTTISQCIKGERPPPEGQLESWAIALMLSGAQRDRFISLGLEAKALAHDAAVPHVQELQERLASQEKRLKQLERQVALRDSLLLHLLPPRIRNRLVHQMASIDELEELDPAELTALRDELEAAVDKRQRGSR